MRVPAFDLTRQYSGLSSELEDAVLSVLRSGRYVLGPVVEEFEAAFARYCGVEHCVGVASGTDALVISLRAVGVGPGDEVIVPAFTFFATAEAVANVGATPVFADVDPETMCITADEVERRLSPKTKAVVPVHLFGHPAPVDEIGDVISGRGVALVEDAAQAAGSSLSGRRAGSFGVAAAFSFYPTKNLGAAGDGGAITTQSDDVARLARMLRCHGEAERYRNEMLGYNSRLDALQAAVLLVKLRHLDEFNRRRRENASLYKRLLADVEQISLPLEAEGAFHTYHQFTIRVLDGRRDELAEYLRRRGVGTAIYYPVPLHRLPPFQSLCGTCDLPNADMLARQVLSLPIFPELEPEEIEYVALAIRDFFGL